MIHEPILAVVQTHFEYLFEEYDFTPVKWYENTRGHGFYRLRLESPTHVVEFRYDAPFINSWVGLTATHYLYTESLLIGYLDPNKTYPDAFGILEKLRDMLPLDAIAFQLERLSRLVWKPYLDRFMALDLYSDEEALVASAMYPWMVRKNEWIKGREWDYK